MIVGEEGGIPRCLPEGVGAGRRGGGGAMASGCCGVEQTSSWGLEQRGEGLGELSGVAHAAGPESPACAHATALGPFKECFFF